MPVKTGIQNSLKTLQYDLVVMDCRDPIRLTWIFPRTHPAGRDAGMTEAADEIKTELDQLSGIVKM
jgi:hypothetical protein